MANQSGVVGKVMIVPRGQWVSANTYKVLDLVTHLGNSYLSRRDNNTSALTVSTDWFKLTESIGYELVNGQYILKVDGVAVNPVSDIDSVIDSVTGATIRDLMQDLKEEIDQLRLKDAEYSNQLKELENTITSANLNQADTLTVSGRDILILPPNASNGGMSVKLEGLTAGNLVINGDFNSSVGWITTGQGTIVDGEFVATTLGASSWRQNINASIGDMVYFGGIFYSLSGANQYDTPCIIFRDSNSNTKTLSNPTEIPTRRSGIHTVAGDVGQVCINNHYAGAVDHHFDKIFAINLTATFGAGNEPDLATCDAMFSDYFEGVKSFEPTGRVRSDIGGRNYILTPEDSVFNNSDRRVRIENGVVYWEQLTASTSPYSLSFSQPIIKGDYIISFKSNTSENIRRYIASSSINSFTQTETIQINENEWLITGLLLDLETSSTTLYFYGTNPFEPTKEVAFWDFKLEKGNKATDWTPSPEDVLAGTAKGTGTSLYLTAPELRSNGTVKDEIRKGSNGYELVKRVGEGTIGVSAGHHMYTAYPNVDILDSILPSIADIIQQTSDDNSVKRTLVIDGITECALSDREDITKIGMFYISATNRVDFIVAKGTTLEEAQAIIANKGYRFTLATPVITQISHGGILNSAENGTVYHEPVIADAGVYGTDIPIFNTDYPIASIEEIIKHENGVDTYLNVATAVIAPDGLSFTHPDLGSGDLVLFTYAFDKESTNGNITATFYDSNVVKIDTVTGKAYKITDVVTNGELTRTLTEV